MLNPTYKISDRTINNKGEWRNWENWRVTIDDIEALTGFDFFTNIPKVIQDDIEMTLSPVITLNASLLSSTSEIYDSYSSSHNSTVGHDSILKNSIFGIEAPRSTAQISTSEVSTSEISSTKIGTSKIGTTQISPLQLSFPQVSSFQVGTLQIGKYHEGFTEISSAQVGITEIKMTKVDSFIVDNTSEISRSKVDPTQINSTQITNFKISLPSSISFQQFFNFQPWQKFFIIHNPTLESINTYKDNPLNLFDPTNPFNLTLQITDLPTGQLAEAQITKYDQYDRPKVGTILIDDDANGIGWFIDPTPNDNSEYTTTGEAAGIALGIYFGRVKTTFAIRLRIDSEAVFENEIALDIYY